MSRDELDIIREIVEESYKDKDKKEGCKIKNNKEKEVGG